MSRGIPVRETIGLLCRIFQDNGMTFVEAETLRKAKFNKPEACAGLWRLLFELITFCQCSLSGSGVFTALNTNMTTEDQAVYVKKEMQRRGYLSRMFAALPTDASGGSRELLLAVAWLLNKENIITRFMDNRSSPIDDDVLSLYESVESEEGWKPPLFDGPAESGAHRVQRMLVLNTKLQTNLRLLHASQQEYASLTHRIHSATYGVSLSPDLNHLTTLQVHMLRHPQHMKKVLSLLEQDSMRLENLLKWEDSESAFWEWMESVLELKLQQDGGVGDTQGDSQVSPSPPPTPRTIFIDVPPTIGAHIAASRHNLMSMILGFESAIDRLEEVWATKRCSVSQWELDKLLGDINTEIGLLESCLGRQPSEARTARGGTGATVAAKGPRLALVKNRPGGQGQAKVTNAQAASSHDNQQETSVSIQGEISRLQDQANLLERELTDVRRHCLHKLNGIVAAAPNTICVLPPQLRNLCQ